MDQASREASDPWFADVLQHSPARRSSLTIIAVITAGVAAVWWQPEVMGMWFDRNVMLSDAQWPKRTTLVVDLPDGELTGARGDDLELRASVRGEVPRTVTVVYESQDGTRGRDTMTAVGERAFRYTFPAVEQAFRFKLTGGDDETDWYQAHLADRPKVARVALSVEPPAYTGFKPFTAPPDQRAVEVLLGSKVTIDVDLNKPVVVADLATASSTIASAAGAGTSRSITITPSESRTYHFALLDELDLANKRPVKFSITVIKDKPPRVRMKINGPGDIITAGARLPMELSYSDTYGLAAATLTYEVSTAEGDPINVPLDGFRDGMTVFQTSLNWTLDALRLNPGDRITLFAAARDFDDVSGPNEAQSPAVVFRIVTNDELLAELARREQEFRADFERLIDQQEDLRRQLLTVIGRVDDADPQMPKGAAPLERRQRQIIGQVNLLHRQFEQVLTELEINGLDTVAVRERLDRGIVQPLGRLTTRDLVAAADLIRDFGRTGDDASAADADAEQAAVLAEMRRILRNMLKWEGYQEAVTMLRDILRLETELNEETRQELDRRAAEILNGG